MKKGRKIGDYVEDIIDAMTRAVEFVEGMSYDEFAKDIKTVYAVTGAIEIIGEAVKHIPNEIREKYPDIPWKKYSGNEGYNRSRLLRRQSKADLGSYREGYSPAEAQI